MELLRFATAGSVDDGKSTLIGRLLYDSKAIFEDQLEAVERTSEQMGAEYTNLALLTDGLRAEREQGITIDVAYRYFATPRRKFIIADTPGHIQYTRNMVTGASTADLALILVDVRNGVIEQTKRHSFISSLLRIPHLVVCVNKMDLVDYDEDAFKRVRDEFKAFATKLDITDLTIVPVSALKGDNIVERSANMPWYEGSSLLHHMEELHIGSDRNLIDARFPVQYVLRPQSDEFHDFRGYAGTVAGGTFRVGDEVMVLPSGFTSTITHIETKDGNVEDAFPPMAVSIRLADDIDISRGDMICRPGNQPTTGQDLDAMVCWMTEQSSLMRAVEVDHQAHDERRSVHGDQSRLPPRCEHAAPRRGGTQLDLNEIGRVQLRTTKPMFFDEYRRSRQTGSFILIDENTNNTVGAGMILGEAG